MKHFIIIATLLLSLSAVAQNTGLYLPFPDQAPIVDFYIEGKTKYAVTENMVMKEKKKIFLSIFSSRKTIKASANLKSNIIVGTENGLFKVNKKNNAATSIKTPQGQTGAVCGIEEHNNTIYIAFENIGIYTLENESDLKLHSDKKGIKNLYKNGKNIYALVGDGILILEANKWKKYSIEEYSEINSDSIFNIKSDNYGNLWLMGKKHVHILDIKNKKDGKIPFKNKFNCQTMPIYDFIAFENTNYVFLSHQNTYTNKPGGKSPLDQFGVATQFYETKQLLKESATLSLKRATGFRTAERIFDDKINKMIWLVNSNGAIGLTYSEFKSIL